MSCCHASQSGQEKWQQDMVSHGFSDQSLTYLAQLRKPATSQLPDKFSKIPF